MAGFEQHFINSFDGTRLAYRDYPPQNVAHGNAEARLPVVCLPGLTRNSRDFHTLAIAVSTAEKMPRRVIAVDYRGRGLSDRAADPATYSVATEMQDLMALLEHLEIARALFIGTSRGGLILQVLASVEPQRIAGAILNDIGPELALQGLIDIQAYLKEAPQLMDWAEVTAHLRQIHGQSFPILSDTDWQEMAHAIYADADNEIRADCDPVIPAAFSAADLTATPLPALWEAFDAFPPAPMMVVRGEHSTLLTPETVAAMQDRRPELVTLVAYGQGHAPLLHVHDVQEEILAFLTGIRS
jgi:pimeloyl-ACP methyl ester carboxylesterase